MILTRFVGTNCDQCGRFVDREGIVITFDFDAGVYELDEALCRRCRRYKRPWLHTSIERITVPVGEHFQPGSTVTIYGEGEQ